jgi:hypothetical protein
MNQLFIGIILAMGVGGYFYYTASEAKIEELTKLNQAYELRDKEQQAAIGSLETNLKVQTSALIDLQATNAQIQTEMNEYLDIFRRHNLGQIASARPGQVELRANRATEEVFNELEDITNPNRNDNND